MKNAVLFCIAVFGLSFASAQESEVAENTTLKVERASYQRVSNGDSVEITYRHANGAIAQQGYLRNGKPVGTWKQFDAEGHVIAKGTYVDGKREGTWFFLSEDGIRIANYSNNKLVSHAISKEGYALLND